MKTNRRLYCIWRDMRARCNYPHNKNYDLYKGMLCSEWEDKNIFMQWALENGYKDNLTIDRIDNSKGYYPENCQFITLGENVKKANETKGKKFRYKGKFYNIKYLALETKINENTLRWRLMNAKWDLDKALEDAQ